MELLIDANILFSVLIKDSFTSNLLLNKNFILYTPEYIVEEFLKYKEYILKKTLRSEEDYIKISHMLKYRINDKKIKEQNKIKIYSTDELAKIIN